MTSLALSRRALLAATGLAFAQIHARAQEAGAEKPARAAGFPLGVASGSPRPDSVVLWTKLSAEPLAADGMGGMGTADAQLRWELSDDEGFSRIRQSGTVLATAALGHSVRVKVRGLSAARGYFYRFSCGAEKSPVGRTRTAPAQDAKLSALRIALASCQHYEAGFFSAWRDVAARELDTVLFVGDYIYENNYPADQRLRRHETTQHPKTLADYRRRYATVKLDADLQAAHAAHPFILTWDDHEVDNDYAADRSQTFAGGEAFLAQRAAAYQAYFEHLPLDPELAPRGADMRIYDRFVFGQLAELWTLDDRQYRSYQACPGKQRAGNVAYCQALFDPQRTLLGEQQEVWLYSGMQRSSRQWKLLGQQTVMAQTAAPNAQGTRDYWNEGWDGYQAARARLFDAISNARLKDVISLGGDVHMNVAADLKRDFAREQSEVIASEFVATSLTSRGRAQAAWANTISSNPHLLHLRSDERGYALLTITPQSSQCNFIATAHPSALEARFASQAQCRVEAGRAGVLRD